MSNIDIYDKNDIKQKLKNIQDQIDELKETVQIISNYSCIGSKKYWKSNSLKSNQYYSNVQKIQSYESKSNYKVVNNLKYIIAMSSYNQKQIAELINISPKTLSNILTNRTNTSLEVALKLSYVLKVSVNDMFRLETIEE